MVVVKRKVIVYVCIAYAILAVGTILGLYQGYKVSEANTTARLALCDIEQEYRKRIQRSLNFLKANPDGIPGIDALLIRNSIRDNRAVLKGLETIHCDEIGQLP